jgi:DNA-binding MarR family transcriptional regulator
MGARGTFQGPLMISGLVSRTTRMMQVALDRRLARHGISFSQMAVLIRFWEGAPRPVSQAQLTTDLGMERSSMSTLLATLERAGLIVGQEDPHDRRRRLLALTPAGRRLERPVAETVEQWEEEFLSGFSATARKQLRGLLEDLLLSASRLRENRPVARVTSSRLTGRTAAAVPVGAARRR